MASLATVKGNTHVQLQLGATQQAFSKELPHKDVVDMNLENLWQGADVI